MTPLEIKDVFYGQLSTSQIKDEEQQPLYYIPDSAYDPKYDYDFTNYKGDDTRCVRGNYILTQDLLDGTERPSALLKSTRMMSGLENEVGGTNLHEGNGQYPTMALT